MKFKYSIVACARWETPYIVEWALYHRSIGFDHIYIYCNDDDPAGLFRQLAPFCIGDNPFVTFIHFDLQGQQKKMYLHYLIKFKNESKWIIFLDIDEFICIRGINSIDKFVNSLNYDFDCLYFNWVFFGNNGFAIRKSGDILENYTKRASTVHPFTKNLIKTEAINLSYIERFQMVDFWHRWESSLGSDLLQRNVIGHPMENYYSNFPDQAGAYLAGNGIGRRILSTAVIFHYAFKSEQDFILRYERGIKGDFGGQVTWKDIHDSGKVKEFLVHLNEVEDTYLRDYWIQLLSQANEGSVVHAPEPDIPNIALGKSCLQSSVSAWSRCSTPAEDAAGAVSGKITGFYQFHTALEDAPWWQVDLGQPYTIREARLFNRHDHPERSAQFCIQVSLDESVWIEIFRKQDENNFGGLDGFPFIWRPSSILVTRYLRISLLRPGILHLDQVQIFGEPEQEINSSPSPHRSSAPVP